MEPVFYTARTEIYARPLLIIRCKSNGIPAEEQCAMEVCAVVDVGRVGLR